MIVLHKFILKLAFLGLGWAKVYISQLGMWWAKVRDGKDGLCTAVLQQIIENNGFMQMSSLIKFKKSFLKDNGVDTSIWHSQGFMHKYEIFRWLLTTQTLYF